MTYLFKSLPAGHVEYAEDQHFSHVILTTHIQLRTIPMASLVGLGIYVVRGVRGKSFPSVRHAWISLSQNYRVMQDLVGRAAHVGVAMGAAAEATRMYGREKIEWQDRAWRLLQNRRQLEYDLWAWSGGVMGMMSAMRWPFTRSKRTWLQAWVRLWGGFGAGSAVGVVTWAVFRYLIRGGKEPGEFEHEQTWRRREEKEKQKVLEEEKLKARGKGGGGDQEF